MYSIFDIISFPCTFVRSFTAFPSTQLNALLLRRNKLRACKVGNACYTYIRFLTLFTFLGMCIFPSSILLKECDIWYSALVHKSSVRAFLLITFNLLKKTILSCKLFFVYSLEFRVISVYKIFTSLLWWYFLMCALSELWLTLSCLMNVEKSLIDENLSS